MQKAIVKSNYHASADFLKKAQALFRDEIAAGFPGYCANQFRAIMPRAVQFGFKLVYGIEPSQDEVKRLAVIPLKARKYH